MSFSYSNELSFIIGEKSSLIMKYGIGMVFCVSLICLSLTNFIKSYNGYNATVDFSPKVDSAYLADIRQNNVKPNGNQAIVLIPIEIELTVKTIEDLKINEKVIFSNVKSEAIICAISNRAIYHDGKIIVILKIKPLDAKSAAGIMSFKGKATVFIIQNETTIFNRLFNHIIKSAK